MNRFPLLLRCALVATFFATILPKASAQSYGLTTRPNVGAYLDGVLPPQPPVASSTYKAVVAFPSLHFDNAMGLLPFPASSRLVVWEREGRIYSFANSTSTTDSGKTLMLNLSNQCQGWDDMGLLNIAFHPNFATNRYLYVFYSWVAPGTVVGNATTRPKNASTSRERLARFTVNASGIVDPASEYVIIDQTAHNTWHKGSGLFFHPGNGFLYLTNGNDNSSTHDQVIDRGLFGCVIRIDVDKRGGSISHAPVKRGFEEVGANWPNSYFVPNSNPFVNVSGAIQEIYALGLRSPHRMTIDAVTQRIFIGDVGNTQKEEIDVIEPTDPAGLNFQWRKIEGYNGDMPAGTYVGVNKRPILDYQHGTASDQGNAVIGGHVYRGSQFPELVGKYLFADNVRQHVWVMDESTHTATTPASKMLLTTVPRGPGVNSGTDYLGISSWGYDANNELYLCQMGTGTSAANDGGQIYKLARGGGASGAPIPPLLSQTGVFSNLSNLTPSAKLIPYALNAPFWSDNAIKTRWATIPDDTTVGFSPQGEWAFPTGSVLVKHFELATSEVNPGLRKRLETRLLVQMANGAAYGATYKWRADNSEADLLDSSVTENVPIAIAPVGTLTGADLGTNTPVGSTSRTGNAVTIVASGTDIWGTSDKGHFASQARTGDFDLFVRIESLTQPDVHAKAGLMVRESLAADSRQVFAMVYPSNVPRGINSGGYELQYRATTGGISAAIYPTIPQPTVNFPNTWLRLQRSGNTFIGYSGTDGIAWREYGRITLALPATVSVGLAATAHAASPATTTAKFHLQTTRNQTWYYPSRADCTACHNQTAGGVLGPNTRQLNKTFPYPSSGVTDNQIRSWNHIGLFRNAPAESAIPGFAKLAGLDNLTASKELRARSYLDANCSYCHRPGGVQALWDARFDTALAQQGIVYGPVGSDIGITGGKVIVPHDVMRSILFQRVSRVGLNQMPPLARNQIDTVGVSALADWIGDLTPTTPTIALTAPVSNSTFTRPASVTITANASHPGGISKVDFYQGTTLLGTDATAPYQFVWSNPPVGDYSLTATATSAYGDTAQSAPAVIHVQDAASFSAFVDFELAGTATPSGYLKDTGATYAARGNGQTYGWSRDNTADSRQRTTPTDVRYATFMHLQKTRAGGSTSSWEIAVPNGSYNVRLVAGDADFFDGFFELTAEGVVILSGQPTTTARFLDRTATVTVADGKLTIAPGPNSVNGKLCFIDITRTTTAAAATLARATAPPTIPASDPAASTILTSDNVTLTARAAAANKAVTRVEFWDGEMLLGKTTSAPFSLNWTGPRAPGAHPITIRAFDTAGRLASTTTSTSHVVPLHLEITGTGQNGTTLLKTQVPAGRSYLIQYSEDLATWKTLESNVSDGEILDVEDPTPGAQRYYRLRVLP